MYVERETELVTQQYAKRVSSAGGSADSQADTAQLLVGIDEVGRGSWAGPLVAAAVMLKKPIDGLKDSKLLSARQRQNLSKIIYRNAEIGLGWVEAKVIDEQGLTKAIGQAMKMALDQINTDFEELIVDGSYNYFSNYPCARAVINADKFIPAVSAASIVAKVARDDFMREKAEQFPNYGFEKHVGYGTALHLKSLKEFGVCELHRLSFKPVRLIYENAD